MADAARHAAGQHAAGRAREGALESRRLGLRLDGGHDAVGKAGRDVDCDLARGLQHTARGGQTLELGGAVAAEAEMLLELDDLAVVELAVDVPLNDLAAGYAVHQASSSSAPLARRRSRSEVRPRCTQALTVPSGRSRASEISP